MTSKEYTIFPIIPANPASLRQRGLIYGVGINNAEYMMTPTIDGKRYTCPHYQKWKGMIERCYSPKSLKKAPSYIGCTVAPEWHYFLNFRTWMETQDWRGKELDKDIMYPGNKIYSPETCVFVSHFINGILAKKPNTPRKCLQGVSLYRPLNKYVAKIRMNGNEKCLGYFDTQEEANKSYRDTKRLYLLKMACCEPDIRVKQGFYRHSELYR